MDDKLVTIAKFSDEMGAELARTKLEERGIKAVVMGANALNTMPYLATIEGIKLQVLESEAEQAKEILSAQEEGESN